MHAALAGPALTAAGGRILARGMPAKLYEHGQMQRTVLIEFESVRQRMQPIKALPMLWP